MPVLDVLPWPWGEDILAGLCMIAGVVRPGRRRQAAAWASAHPGRRSWRLVASLCAFRGRWAARTRLLGLRSPAHLRRHLVVEGEAHLTASPGGVILLAFHVGPPGADVALTVLGHRVTWLGWEDRITPGRRRPAWRSVFEPSLYLSVRGNPRRWPALLHRARRILLDGGIVYTTADGRAGRELFSVPLPGGPVVIRAGWMALHRHTGAHVLPILTHLEGRTMVVTIHPALPTRASDPVGEVDAWREVLTRLLEDYVRRFPEQCIGLVFRI